LKGKEEGKGGKISRRKGRGGIPTCQQLSFNILPNPLMEGKGKKSSLERNRERRLSLLVKSLTSPAYVRKDDKKRRRRRGNHEKEGKEP